MLRHFALPGIAASVAGALYVYLTIGNFFGLTERLAIAGISFTCLLVLANHFRHSLALTKMQRASEAASGYESAILRRLDQLEQDLHKLQKSTVTEDRLNALQGEIAETLAAIVEPAPKPDFRQNENPPATPASDIAPQDNVIRIPSRARGLQQGSGQRDLLAVHPEPGKKELGRMAAAKILRDGTPKIFLQPIVDLIRRVPVAVEAKLFYTLDGENHDAEKLAQLLDAIQLTEMNFQFIELLQRVYRNMKRKQQVLPVQFALPAFSKMDSEALDQLIDRLHADPDFAKTALMSFGGKLDMRTGGLDQGRRLALRETGARLSLTCPRSMTELKRALAEETIAMVSMPIADLLRYERDSEARSIEAVLPMLEEGGCMLVATGVSEPHEAASLIDLDIQLAQGDFISPAREVRLSDAKPPNADGYGLG